MGNGDAKSEIREVSDFSGVKNFGEIDVHITMLQEDTEMPARDLPSEVEVICDSNLLEYIEIYTEDKTLRIDVQPLIEIDPQTRCVVEIRTTQIHSLSASGSGDIHSVGVTNDLRSIRSSGSGNVVVDAVHSESLNLSTHGSGDLKVAGKVRDLDLQTSGSGSIAARDLVTETVRSRSSGSGDVEIYATASVDVRTSGSGDVDIWGTSARRKTHRSGSGKIHFR